MGHQGVILRKLRQLNSLTIKQASERIGRGAGWISEIENGKGEARIYPAEFERIIAAYNGESYRKQFSIWIANASKGGVPKHSGYSGAIIKHLRKKSGFTLKGAASKIGITSSYLSYIEVGAKPLSDELKNQLMGVYGYSPTSFRNFATEDKRAKSIPDKFKLDVLLRRLDEDRLRLLFQYATQLDAGNTN